MPLSKERLGEGEAVDVSGEVSTPTNEGQPMFTAIVGLPGVLEARADQFKELVRECNLDAFKMRGRGIVLYWRAMERSSKKSLVLGAVAGAGEYMAPASRAHLY